MGRFKNANWTVNEAVGNPNSAENVHEATLAVLMDLRDEMQALNRVFACQNFLRVPRTLDQIRKNTTKKRKPKKLRMAS